MSIVFTFVCSLIFAIIFLVPLGGVIGGWVWGRVGGRLLKVSAVKRSYLLSLFASIPLLWAFMVVGLGLVPSVASVVWPELDHCVVHDDGHPHLCFDHWAVEGLPGWMWVSLVVVMVQRKVDAIFYSLLIISSVLHKQVQRCRLY